MLDVVVPYDFHLRTMDSGWKACSSTRGSCAECVLWDVGISGYFYKTERPKSSKNMTGRVRSRTEDLSHAKGARYQLRHTPDLQDFL